MSDAGTASFWELCAGAFLLSLCVSEALLLIGSELDPVVGRIGTNLNLPFLVFILNLIDPSIGITSKCVASLLFLRFLPC